MDRVKDMQASEHGRYTEITNEKEVIRASAYVSEVQLLSFTPLILFVQERAALCDPFLPHKLQAM
jgi:hypothetical protein